MRVMNGETVSVETRIVTGTDRLGNPTYGYAEPVTVDNVLVSWNTTAERDYTRPDGFVVTCTCAFPRSCALNLEGARLTIGTETVYVDGNPQREMSPNAWNMLVSAGVQNG